LADVELLSELVDRQFLTRLVGAVQNPLSQQTVDRIRQPLGLKSR
jgi:hypothetical protein